MQGFCQRLVKIVFSVKKSITKKAYEKTCLVRVFFATLSFLHNLLCKILYYENSPLAFWCISMNSSLPTNDLEALSQLICASLKAHCATIFVSESATKAKLVASHSTRFSALQASVIDHGKGLIGWILRNKHALIINEFDTKHTQLGYYAQNPAITAFMGVPFQDGGVLCVDRIDGNPFTEDDQALLRLFAENSVFFLKNAAQSAKFNEELRLFEGLSRILDLHTTSRTWPDLARETLDILSECTPFEYAAFASVQDGDCYAIEAETLPLLLVTQENTFIPTSQGVAGWVFRNALPVYTEGYGETSSAPLFGKDIEMPHYQATVCTPVYMDKNLCGVLCLGHVHAQEMSEQFRAFMNSVAQCFTHSLEQINLRYRLSKLLPKTGTYRTGSYSYDPDTDPSQAGD